MQVSALILATTAGLLCFPMCTGKLNTDRRQVSSLVWSYPRVLNVVRRDWRNKRSQPSYSTYGAPASRAISSEKYYEPKSGTGNSEEFRSWRKRRDNSLKNEKHMEKGGKPPDPAEVARSLHRAGASFAGGMLHRGRRSNLDLERQYDVPQIECVPAEDGMERVACPSPDRMGRYKCIDGNVLCDGFIDCPNSEDEHKMSCMFYEINKAHLDVLADAVMRWVREGKK